MLIEASFGLDGKLVYAIELAASLVQPGGSGQQQLQLDPDLNLVLIKRFSECVAFAEQLRAAVPAAAGLAPLEAGSTIGRSDEKVAVEVRPEQARRTV